MTTIVGINCVDGIVIASDSQSGFNRGVKIKRQNVPKIHILGSKYSSLIAGSGTESDVRKVIDTVTNGLNQFLEDRIDEETNTINMTKDELDGILENCLVYLHRRYNIEKSKDLGYTEPLDLFDPISIFCSRIDYQKEENPEDARREHLLYILHSTSADIEQINEYATIGTGSAFAEYLLGNLYKPEVTVEEACMIAPYVIQEVMKIDPDTGGQLIVVAMRNTGDFETLTSEQVETYVKQVKPSLDKVVDDVIPKIIRGEIDSEKLDNI